MQIVTYNIWNSVTDKTARQEMLCQELNRVNADVVALQEVSAIAEQNYTQYPHTVFRRYPEHGNEGVGFLSKYPVLSAEAGWEFSAALHNCGLRVRLRINAISIAVTNVHLDYKSIAVREAQILAVTDWIAARSEPDCMEILCGDFNSYPESSVYRFLRGQQTLNGQESLVWHDLAAIHAYQCGNLPSPTLDFQTNPRWTNNPTLEIPAQFDWILVQECWPASMPMVKNVELIGRYPMPGSNIVPSDHYGVLADLEMT
jgi:maltose 6'-phosphate phosphatase